MSCASLPSTRRTQGLLDLGRHSEAVGELLALVAEHPLHERFYAQLMLALYRSERQSEAMRAYEAVRSTLLDELGLDPGPELQALARAVLSQAPTLDWAPPIAALRFEPRVRRGPTDQASLRRRPPICLSPLAP